MMNAKELSDELKDSPVSFRVAIIEYATNMESELAATNQKLEAAEADLKLSKIDFAEVCEKVQKLESRIKASQEQEPVAAVELITGAFVWLTDERTNLLFASSIIPPTEAELLQRIAELEKQLNER